MHRIFIVFFLLYYSSLNAQDWEVLLIEKEDTSLSSRKIIELDSGDLLLVVENYLFHPNSVGVFIEGFPKYGVDLMKVNQNNTIDTSFFLSVSPEFRNGSLLNFDQSVIFTVEVYTSVEPCISPHPTIGSFSRASDLGLSKFDSKVNEALKDTLYIHRDSAICGLLEFVQFANCQNTLYALRYNSNESKLLLDLIDPVSLEMFDNRIIDISVSPQHAYFDCEEEAFLIYCDNGGKLCKMDFYGNIQWSVDSIGLFTEVEVSLDNQFYWLNARIPRTNERFITKLDKEGKIISSKLIANHTFADIEPIDDGLLLALENRENEILIHVINESGRIISTESFVYERIIGRSVKLLSNGEVVILAQKVDAFNLGVCCIEVGENSPNKVMLIKKPLEQIWNPNIFQEEDVVVFPNPVKSSIEILFKDYFFDLESNFHYVLHSLNGEKIQEGKIHSPSQLISLDSLPTAMYLISIIQDKTIIKTQKLIKN